MALRATKRRKLQFLVRQPVAMNESSRGDSELRPLEVLSRGDVEVAAEFRIREADGVNRLHGPPEENKFSAS